jgi:hypothetical protein
MTAALSGVCQPLVSAEALKLSNLLLCGGNVVYDAEVLRDGASYRWGSVRSWMPEKTAGLPLKYCLVAFEHTDECKPVDGGKSVLVTASTGGVAIFNRTSLATSFYAMVPNAHSACLLPGGHLVVASSTPANGNALVVFHRAKSEATLFRTPLEAAHGVDWDEERKTLYAIGFDTLYEYNFDESKPSLTLKRQYKLPGPTGHELSPGASADELLLSIDDRVLAFDKKTGNFTPFEPLARAVGIKCVSMDRQTKLTAYIQCEDIRGRWWSFDVRFAGATATLASPGQRLYKIRWAEKP